jgi:hypothetical protein
MSDPLAPQYDPAAIEADLYRRWLAADLFRADARDTAERYVVMMPPPNVTAVLHVGHGLNNTVQDVLVRFERMRGRNTLWLPAPITPASRRRTWSSARWRRRARPASTWGASASWSGSGPT